jgi:hypothetical protein
MVQLWLVHTETGPLVSLAAALGPVPAVADHADIPAGEQVSTVWSAANPATQELAFVFDMVMAG